MSDTVLQAASHNALPIGTRLDEFEIRSVIGEGGFGIVYHAFDHALEREVAIKEYMPSAMAARNATMHVSVLSQGHVETFTLGLRSFVNEARLLARFDHPSLVKVHRFWEANGTAYMVMPYYRGRTLKAMRKSLSASPSEAWLRSLVEPLLGALEALHREGVYHRDIAPDNILLCEDGPPVLLDFGAARRVISDQSQALTAILKPNFAPIEQYAETEGLRQGPWTDLYALGATLHFVITGTPPQPATARAMGSQIDRLASVARRGVSGEFLRMVDWMMAPRPEDRPQSVAALRAVLGGSAAPAQLPVPTDKQAEESAWKPTLASDSVQDTAAAELAVMEAVPTREVGRGARRTPGRRRRWSLIAGTAILAAGVATGWMLNEADHPLALAAAMPAAATPATSFTPAAASAPAAAPAPLAASEPVVASVAVAASASVVEAATVAPASLPSASAAALAAAPAVPASAIEQVASVAPAASHPTLPAPPARAKRPPKPAVAAAPKESSAESAAPSSPPIAVDVAAVTPSEQCSGRVLLAWYRCVKRACQSAPAFASRHECQRVRQIEADNARPRSQ
jgi:serine/threonine protein kinase